MKTTAILTALPLAVAATKTVRFELDSLDIAAHAVRGPSSPDDTFCDLVNPDLPSECTCTANDEGGVVDCSVSLFGDDVTFIANVQPCASPADVKFEIKDTTFGVDYTKTISLDDTEQFDIPGTQTCDSVL